MRKLIIGFVFFLLLLGGGGAGIYAGITERIIYAGNTPLASDCQVTQTGPMQLTISICSWTTTGQGRIFNTIMSLPAQAGVGSLAEAIRQGNAEWLPGGFRVRGWLTNKQGNIIEKSRIRTLPINTVLNIVAGERWVVYLVDGPGVTMDAVLQKASDPNQQEFWITSCSRLTSLLAPLI